MHPAGRIYGSGGGNVTVSGIVTSADDKQPLIGVNVISGATSGVSTLADGTYRITVSCGYSANGKQVRRSMTWRKTDKKQNPANALFMGFHKVFI